MRRRFVRILFTFCTAASLLLCLATAVMWVRAARGSGDRASIRLETGRYAARFDGDALRLVGPPRPLPPGQETIGFELADRIRNHHLGWTIYGRMVNGAPTAIGTVMDAFPTPDGGARAWGTPLAQYRSYTDGTPFPPYASLARPLTRALEDPDKWVVAHYYLWFEQPRPARSLSNPLVRDGEVYVRDMGGLRVELPVPGPDTPRHVFPKFPDRFEWIYWQDGPISARIDPSQHTKIRDLWHDRLGVTQATVPYWWVILAAMVLPAWSGFLRYRLILRARRVGLCPTCGYDLRASPELCPECGMAVQPVAVPSASS